MQVVTLLCDRGLLQLSSANVEACFRAATYLEMPALVRTCTAYLMEHTMQQRPAVVRGLHAHDPTLPNELKVLSSISFVSNEKPVGRPCSSGMS